MDRSSFFTFFCFLVLLSMLERSFANDRITPNQPLSDGETLVSPTQKFVLGFFSPPNSLNRYLGVWYQKCPRSVVWVANRDQAINNTSGIFSISKIGNLVLLDGAKNVIWSANLSRLEENPIAQILDSGNFIICGNTSRNPYLWQSFDYPSDTLLPGMKLGWDLNTKHEKFLTSWRSPDDPSPGDFTYRLNIDVLPELVVSNGSIRNFRSGPWDGDKFAGVSAVPNFIFRPTMVSTQDEIYYMYESISDTLVIHLTLNGTGFTKRMILDMEEERWHSWYTMPFDRCDSYNYCGANSVCSISKEKACNCLNGFVEKPEVHKCARVSEVDCKAEGEFTRLAGVKLPDLLQVQLKNSLDLQECKEECLNNCSCTAYAKSNLPDKKGCLLWYGDLIDMREVSDEYRGQEIYIRTTPKQGPNNIYDWEKFMNSVLLYSVLPYSLIAAGNLIVGIVFCIFWTKKGRKAKQVRNVDLDVTVFDFTTIRKATNNFSNENIIGKGGFGPVYKGTLSTGQEVAVKRLAKDSQQGIEEFRAEIVAIAKLQHKNLVALLGICAAKDERMLIYEFMPNKSLHHFIFDQKGKALLPWPKRFDIIMGIARGLLYLHQDSKLPIIHRDLKASNILLDSNMNPKISDFGLARTFEGNNEEMQTTRVVGTYGYMSPEYVLEGTFSVKSDIFSLGVLILEIISGKRNPGYSHTAHHQLNLLGHTWLLWRDADPLEVMDKCLKASCVRHQVLRCVQVGLLCVQQYPESRPPMSSVVFMLTSDDAGTLPQPEQPGFFFQRSSASVVMLAPGNDVANEGTSAPVVNTKSKREEANGGSFSTC